jgi:hypothetical protein
MRTVIKAQRALNAASKVLIYNQDRSVFQELENDSALLLAIGDRPKCYFEVTIDDRGQMTLIREKQASW